HAPAKRTGSEPKHEILPPYRAD
ncbi:tyrosine recombinase XerC, partial [Vibrio parahaemolyticus VPTS-2010]